jgi:signal peptidase I
MNIYITRGDEFLQMSNKILKIAFEYIQILLIAFLLSLGLKYFIIEIVKIPTGSMIPTIQLQERVMVDKIYYRFSGLNRGDVIVFIPPPELGYKDPFIKRLIGIPGDTIKIENGVLFVNDKAVKEPYLNEKPTHDFGPIEVEKDKFFVMGDNRNSSADSREWGTLSKENVTGRAMLRTWPLNRIGLLK